MEIIEMAIKYQGLNSPNGLRLILRIATESEVLNRKHPKRSEVTIIVEIWLWVKYSALHGTLNEGFSGDFLKHLC